MEISCETNSVFLCSSCSISGRPSQRKPICPSPPEPNCPPGQSTKQMKTITRKVIDLLSLALGAAILLPAGAQEVLPRPEQPFGGRIGLTAQDSVKDFPKEVQAPKGAPNILLILTDAVDFGASSTFGGPIPTAT